MNYYNEFDKYPAQWLRNLSDAGYIPRGVIDERSITEIEPRSLEIFNQCHFFSGLGGWPYALRLAQWPEDRQVWTGSCPCQPFSNAGKRRGTNDERHLWPAFRWLIAQCRPSVIFGEQVASKDGRAWLAGIRSDLEALGYRFGAADLCAAGIGAPQIRQRLFWVAYTESTECECTRHSWTGGGGFTDSGGLVNTNIARPQGWNQQGNSPNKRSSGSSSMVDGMANSDNFGRQSEYGETGDKGQETRVWQSPVLGDCGSSCWGEFEFIECEDGKQRRIESGIRPLAHGVPARVGALKAYGNAIVPQVAAQFIKSFMEITSKPKGNEHANIQTAE